MTEYLKESFDIAGLISSDLDVVGEKYPAGVDSSASVKHMVLRNRYNMWEDKTWRYHSDKGDVRWWHTPTPNEKQAVNDWLKEKYNIIPKGHFNLIIREEKMRVYNKTLEPNLWNENQQLDPEVRKTLLQVAEDFYESTDLQGPIIDVFLIGSSANYNWTPASDCDVHIIIDITKEKINPKYARKFMDSLNQSWNSVHEIEVKGHPVEVYLQDQTEPNGSPETFRPKVAIFSLKNNQWIQRPQKEVLDLDKETIKRKYRELKAQIEKLLSSDDYTGLKSLMKKIKNYRNAGLKAEGEFGTENLVFKALRHTGMLGKLKDGIQSIYDKKTSITEGIENQKPFIITGATDQSLNVVGQKYYEGEQMITHGVLRSKYGASSNSEEWRYRSDINVLFWWGIPDEDEREATLDWLARKHRVVNPKEITAKTASDNIKHLVHYPWVIPGKNIEESDNSEVYYITGVVTKNLNVISKRYSTQQKPDTHADLYRKYGINLSDGVSWRYHSKENTIFWWEEPTPEQKKEVEEYLKSKYHITSHKNLPYSSITGTMVLREMEENPFGGNAIFNENLGWTDDRIILGNITDDLEINRVENKPARLSANHKGRGDRWRYRTHPEVNDYVFWWENNISDEKKNAVADFLINKYGAPKNLKHKNLWDFKDKFQAFLHGGSIEGEPDFYNRSRLKEGKFNPFKAKELQFVTYGGLSPTKQKGFKNEPGSSFHGPPARKGIYAFVWPYVEKFLLGGYQDPKKRGKGQRNRIEYVKDKEGNVIKTGHPDFEKLSDIPKNWTMARKRPDAPGKEYGDEGFEWDKEYFNVLYRNSPRKKFSYNGPIWHHLSANIKPHEILNEKGDWIKTDMATYRKALLRELQMMKVYKNKNSVGFTLDHLEVFIDQKI